MGTIVALHVSIWNAVHTNVPLWDDIQVNDGFPLQLGVFFLFLWGINYATAK